MDSKTLSFFFSLIHSFMPVVEIRYLKTAHGIISGMFTTDEEGAAALASEISRLRLKKNTAYRTINYISDEYLGDKDLNKLFTGVKSTVKDGDISKICFFPIDLDPIRPTGVSATDTEKDHAKTKAETIIADLNESGFSAPLVIDSGNGYNVLYAVSVDNTKENCQTLKKLNTVIAEKYSDKDVDVDKSVTNPGRIFKLPGTISAKGENSADRPHRYSRLVSAPDELVPTQLEVIRKYIQDNIDSDSRMSERVSIKDNKVPPEGSSEGHKGIRIRDLEGYLNSYDWDYSVKQEGEGRQTYVLDVCPMNPEHNDKAAYFTRFENGITAFRCHHAHCQQYSIEDVIQKYPLHEIPVMCGKDKTTELYNRVIDSTSFYKTEFGKRFLKSQDAKMLAYDSEECKSYIRSFILKNSTIYSQSTIDTVWAAIEPVFNEYAEDAVVGNRILQTGDMVYYKCSDDYVVAIGNGKAKKCIREDIFFNITAIL